MVLDLVLVPEGAQHVGGQHEQADQRHARRCGEDPGERQCHLPEVEGSVVTPVVADHVRGVGDDTTEEPSRTPGRHTPGIAGGHADERPHDEEHGRQHVADAQDHREHSDAPVALDRHPCPERHQDQRRILLHQQRQEHEDRIHPPSTIDGGVDGHPHQGSDEAVRMEVLAIGPTDGRVQQIAGGQHHGKAVVVQQTFAEEVDRHGTQGDREGLGEEQRSGTGECPEHGHQEDEDERRVIAHQVAAHQGDERRLETRHEPDALVVQAVVVGRGTEAVMRREGDSGEVRRVSRHQRDERPLPERDLLGSRSHRCHPSPDHGSESGRLAAEEAVNPPTVCAARAPAPTRRR